jgi:hypothetical protein
MSRHSINGRPLHANPISALNELADVHLISRPVYVEGIQNSRDHHAVVEVANWGYEVGSGTSRQEAKTLAAQALLERILLTLCPTPRKRRFATWERAYDEMLLGQAHGKAYTQVYACRCDWWHLSGAAPRGWNDPIRMETDL